MSHRTPYPSVHWVEWVEWIMTLPPPPSLSL